MEERSIVYCTKCGTSHADDATVCVNCGAPLYGASSKGKSYVRYGRYEREGFPRRGKPIWGIIIGLIIIFAGFSLLLSELYNIDIPWVPILLILFGVYILVRFFQMRSRRR